MRRFLAWLFVLGTVCAALAIVAPVSALTSVVDTEAEEDSDTELEDGAEAILVHRQDGSAAPRSAVPGDVLRRVPSPASSRLAVASVPGVRAGAAGKPPPV